MGRDKEVKLIRNLILREDIKLVTLTGLGGIGKTSLALHVAASLESVFKDGVFFIGLASLTNSEAILVEIARILKVEQNAKKNILDGLRDFLSSREILLVLDNFEHLMHGASQVGDILQIPSAIKIIVTSRESLHLRAEQIFPIPSLSSEYSIELFTKRAQSLNPDFLLSKGDTQSVVELCKRLDGLPLAIELAALRTKLFTPQAMLARLEPDLKPATPILDLLSFGARDLPKRQQSLRNTIAWSYGLLQAEEQSVFRAASIFPAGFSIQMLSVLLKRKENDVLEIVSSLVGKSLIKPALDNHTEPHFILLDSIREYAWDEILQFGELEGLKDAFVELYLFFSNEASEALKGDKQAEWFNRLDDEIMNIVLVIEICVTSKQGSERWKKGYPILHNLHRYWMLREHFQLVFQYVARARISMDEFIALTSDDNQDSLKLKAKIYSLSGSLAWVTGNYKQASEWHEISYLCHQDLGDEYGMAEALNNWAVNLGELGERQAAIEKHVSGLALSRKNGDRSSELWVLNNIGATLEELGNVEHALLHFEEALVIARELNDQYFIGSINHNLSHLKLRMGDFDAAISLSQYGLEVAKKIQLPYLQIWSLTIFGIAKILQGNVAVARKAVVESIYLKEKISDSLLQIELLQLIVCIFSLSDRMHEAVQVYGVVEKIRARSEFEEGGFPDLYSDKLVEKVLPVYLMDIYKADRAHGMSITFDTAIVFALSILEKPIEGVNTLSKIPEIPSLTVREREVLIMLAHGLTNEQISKELVVVIKTVEKHVANILMKLGVKNRTEAAAWAIELEMTESRKEKE